MADDWRVHATAPMVRMGGAAVLAAGVILAGLARAEEAPCRTVKERDEIGSLKKGDVIYADLAAKVRIRIATIDLERKRICGRTRKGERCFGADKVYTGTGLAECGRGAALGAILLFGEDDKPDGDEE